MNRKLVCLLFLTVFFPFSITRAADPAPPATAQEVLDTFVKEWQPLKKGYMRSLDDKGWQARMKALAELAKQGQPAIPVLSKALDDPDADKRVFAVQALTFLGEPMLAARMETILEKDAEPAARVYAADALGMFGGLKSKPLYEKAIKEDSNRDVRSHMRYALDRKGQAFDPEVRKVLAGFKVENMNTAKLGTEAPDFTLTDAQGKTHRLADYRGKKSVVLIFVYGDT